MRNCPFCESSNARRFGARRGATFLRCASCRSIYRDVEYQAFERLHVEAFEEDEFLDRVIASLGTKPATEAWDRLELPGTTVLEIGPGAGHLLAGAAARQRGVIAVESSARHRAFIEQTWGIKAIFPSMEDIPADLTVDTILAINVLEHVYDVASFLASIGKHLVPGGLFYFSAPNADALVCSVVRTMWSMFKEPDHVSFPTSASIRAAASKAGLIVEQVWSAEMALETPVGLAVAGRDRWRERGVAGDLVASTSSRGTGPRTENIGGRGSRALARLDSARWARYEPSSVACALLGRAGTIRARLRRPAN